MSMEFTIFKNIFYDKAVSLSELINSISWGSNRIIREQGFKILPVRTGIIHIKKWPIIKDPSYLIEESSFISKLKGQSIIVVNILAEWRSGSLEGS